MSHQSRRGRGDEGESPSGAAEADDSGAAADGIFVEIHVAALERCPVAVASREADAAITDVSRTAIAGSSDVTESFTLDSEGSPGDADVTPVASYDTHTVYQFTREEGHDCFCEVIERAVGPVTDIRAEGGALLVTFHAADLAAVREAVQRLKAQFDGVRVRQLRHADERAASDLVVVDRARLTDRQLEVLRTAHELGYFEYPREHNASEVADDLGISLSTFSEHLTAAQWKITDRLLRG